MQHARGLVDVVAGGEEPGPHLELALDDEGVRARQVLVRRRHVALLPAMERRPAAALAADPQHLHRRERRLLDPRRVRPDERVLDVLENGADVLWQRHGWVSFWRWRAAVTTDVVRLPTLSSIVIPAKAAIHSLRAE